MARLFVDGFEMGNVDNWDQYSGIFTIVTLDDGTRALYLNGVQVFLRKYISLSTPNLVYFQIRCKFNNTMWRWVNFKPFLTLKTADGSSQLTFGTNGVNASTYYISIKRGWHYGTTIASGITPIVPDQWHVFWVTAIVDSTAGNVTIYQDGELQINYTGNTQSAATSDISIFELNTQVGYPETALVLATVDNISIDDSEPYIKESKIVGLSPSGAWNFSMFTAEGEAENWDNVDEKSYSDANYNWTQSDELVDMFEFDDLDGSLEINNVLSVTALGRFFKEGVPDEPYMRFIVSSEGVSGASSTWEPQTGSVKGHSYIWELAPDGGSWSRIKVNNIKAGYQAQDSL